MCSGISLFSRSRSFAIGFTSASTKSRTDRRISSCSAVTSAIFRSPCLHVALANEHRTLVFEHLFAALVVARGAKFHHAPVGPRGVALFQHQRLGGERITRVDGLQVLELLVPEMGDR